MSQPLISVILPIYKVEEYLDRCINSLLAQSYSNLEIILVDDGSPDRCPQMCDEWAKKDSRIRVVHKINGGLSDARNVGFAVATGSLISFIDSDDWVEPDFFRILYEALISNGCDISACNYRKAYGGQTLPPVESNYQCSVLTQTEAMSALIDNRLQQVVWNKLYKRSIVEGILFEKGKYHEDEFWSYQAIGRCETIAVTDYVGLNYFQRADSIMGETYSKKRLDAIEAKFLRQQYLDEHFPDLKNQGRINLLFTCLYHGQLCRKQLSGSDYKEAITYLKSIVKQNHVSISDLKCHSFTHKLWIILCQTVYTLTCSLRNLLKIGM